MTPVHHFRLELTHDIGKHDGAFREEVGDGRRRRHIATLDHVVVVPVASEERLDPGFGIGNVEFGLGSLAVAAGLDVGSWINSISDHGREERLDDRFGPYSGLHDLVLSPFHALVVQDEDDGREGEDQD
jgi:hypothetical protein